MKFIEHHFENSDFSFVKGDLLDPEAVKIACKDVDMILYYVPQILTSNLELRILKFISTRIFFDL